MSEMALLFQNELDGRNAVVQLLKDDESSISVRSSSSVVIKLLRSASRSCVFQLQLVQVATIYALLLVVTCKC